jgi:hypothetical protein
MSLYEAGWRDAYNRRPAARSDPEYVTGYDQGKKDRVTCARILGTLN